MNLKLARVLLAALVSTTAVSPVPAAVHYVNVNNTNPVPPYTSWASAATIIQNAVDLSSPGDEIVVTNGIYEAGGRVLDGALMNRVAVDRAVTLRSVNGPEATIVRGHQVPGTTNGDGAVRCVYLTGGATLAGFTLGKNFPAPIVRSYSARSGATRVAGDSLREQSGGGVWCESTNVSVSNCVFTGNSAYIYGGAIYSGTAKNSMVVSNSADSGGGVCRAVINNCALSGNLARYGGGAAYQATLSNCVLRANSAEQEGGGADFSSTLINCSLIGNSASRGGGAAISTLTNCTLSTNSASTGGGASSSTLVNCVLTGNSASFAGGGTSGGGLINCTLTGNSAVSRGGGSEGSYLNNCIAYFNTAPQAANYYITSMGPEQYGLLNYCCTDPLPTNGVGNISSVPSFVDQSGGNLHLQSNSPCINSGLNGSASANLDLDGNPRVVGGNVDIGAYEFQSPASVISYAWLQRYGLPRDGSADFADPDGDHLNNYQEWRAGTNPTNSQSVLRLRHPGLAGSNVVLTWESVLGRSYFLEASTNLSAATSFYRAANNIPGQSGTTIYTHTNAAGLGLRFYRVGVAE